MVLRRILCIAILIAASCFANATAYTASAQQPTVPAGVSASAEFVDTLQRSGVAVQQVSRSVLEGTFQDARQAAFVRTNLGMAQIVIFNEGVDAERLSITYRRATEGTDVPLRPARHHYLIQGLPTTNGRVFEFDSPVPNYFTLTHRLFIMTDSAELDAAIKRALAQTEN